MVQFLAHPERFLFFVLILCAVHLRSVLVTQKTGSCRKRRKYCIQIVTNFAATRRVALYLVAPLAASAPAISQ